MRFVMGSVLATSIISSALGAPATYTRRTPTLTVRQAGECTTKVINFDDVQFDSQDPHKLEPIADGFAGFNWPDFAIATCAGFACKSFPAETTKTFTRPRLAMAQGLIGGLLTKQLLFKATSSAQFNLADANGSFDLGPFTVFDIIDLPEQVKLGAKEDMRVHLDCGKAGSNERVKKTIPFDRNRDTAGYDVTQENLGSDFEGLSGCKVSTTQVFFPGKLFELEIPTESMGLDNLNVCVR